MTKNNNNGFTLIELLIGLAIVGILIAVAYPSYSHHIVKARRAEAQVALLDLATRMEQYYSENNHSYKNATLANLKSEATTANGFYMLSISNVTATTYILTAKPLGVQAQHDKDCAMLTLDQLGQKNPAECW